MSFNLVDSVKGLFGSDLITKASSMLGESETSLQKAVLGIIPSVLTGVLNKAGSGDAGGILSMALCLLTQRRATSSNDLAE